MSSLKTFVANLFAPKDPKKPDCFSYLRYPQMYAENECYSCPFLEQCDKASGERGKDE